MRDCEVRLEWIKFKLKDYILELMYLFDSFSHPNGEIYKDLVNYPYPKLGVGKFRCVYL